MNEDMGTGEGNSVTLESSHPLELTHIVKGYNRNFLIFFNDSFQKPPDKSKIEKKLYYHFS
jgi:hypothetical protein